MTQSCSVIEAMYESDGNRGLSHVGFEYDPDDLAESLDGEREGNVIVKI